MALTNYSELQTSVKNWIKRADLDSLIPDFITLCEAKFNRRLRISTMESRVTATLDQQYEVVPTDFLEMRSLQITGVHGTSLSYQTPENFNRAYKTNDTGTPIFYTIIDGTIGFAPAPSMSYTMEMVYFKRIPALSGAAPTNWMLTNHPDVYLYGSLAETEANIKNDPRVAMWKSLYNEAIDAVEGADTGARYPGPMHMVAV